VLSAQMSLEKALHWKYAAARRCNIEKQTASEGRHQSTCSDGCAGTQCAQCWDHLTAESSESEPTRSVQATDDNLIRTSQTYHDKCTNNFSQKKTIAHDMLVLNH